VKGHIEMQAVASQVVTQPVGGRPADIFTQIGHAYGHKLLDQCYGDKKDGESSQRIQGAAGQRLIKKAAHNLWFDQLQQQIGEQQRAEPDDVASLRAQVLSQQITVLLKCDVHVPPWSGQLDANSPGVSE
jgi:hypothetical protein